MSEATHRQLNIYLMITVMIVSVGVLVTAISWIYLLKAHCCSVNTISRNEIFQLKLLEVKKLYSDHDNDPHKKSKNVSEMMCYELSITKPIRFVLRLDWINHIVV